MARWKKIVFSDWSVILTCSVLLFLFWGGLVFTAETSDHAGRLIVSYVFIPVAVAVALLLRRNWSWGALGYYTLGIALIKMTVTMTAYMWVIPGGQRVQSKEIETMAPAADIARYEQITVADGAQVTGELRFSDGSNFTDSDWIVALTDVRRGRAGVPQAQHVIVSGAQVSPRILSVMEGDTVVVSNQDQDFHTFALIDRIGQLFQLPLPPERSASRVILRPGFFESRCQRSHDGERMAVYAFAHPYHAVLDPERRFALESIPAARYHLALWRVDHGAQRADHEPDAIRELDLKPGQAVHVVWDIDASGQITGQ